MHLNQVDLNLFIVLDAIYRERNLTRAAETLHITQPAVSNALKRLRQTLNDQLFVRTPHGMLPTPMTENIIVQVQGALQLLTSSVEESDKFIPKEATKEYRFSMGDLMGVLMLPRLLKKLRQTAPNVRISSYQIPRAEIAQALAAGRVDFCIDVLLPNVPDLCHIPLAHSEDVCLVRPDHPQVDNDLTLEQYLSLGHINISSRPSGIGHIDMALNKIGKKRLIQVRLQHAMIAPFIVRTTNLALTSSRTLAESFDLKAVELPFVTPNIGLYLYWHKSADKDQANRWLRETFLYVSANKFD
ncbi:MAG: LysR family transcriptional regulator [Alphaproteobacteria bacterium]|nr:MAG: LysR family transcriptional regulator [Alphaproteobacteria bacterium]